MDIQKLIERVLEEVMSAVADVAPEMFPVDATRSALRAAFDEVRRAALVEMCKLTCSDCAQGIPWYGTGPGYHSTNDTAPWLCQARHIRKLLPPAAEEKA